MHQAQFIISTFLRAVFFSSLLFVHVALYFGYVGGKRAFSHMSLFSFHFGFLSFDTHTHTRWRIINYFCFNILRNWERKKNSNSRYWKSHSSNKAWFCLCRDETRHRHLMHRAHFSLSPALSITCAALYLSAFDGNETKGKQLQK